MAYTPTTWTAGMVLTAAAQNRIEQALAAAAAVADAAVVGYVSGNALDATVGAVTFATGSYTHQVGAGWPTQYGTVTTVVVNINRAYQLITAKETGQVWTRTATGNTSWTPIREILFTDNVGNSQVFARTSTGGITGFNYSKNYADAGTVVIRTDNGQVVIADPTAANQAATKSYVDTAVNDLTSGQRLSAVGRSIDGRDLNEILAPGWYSGANLTNSPGGTGYWYVTVLPHANTSWREQQAFQYGSGVAAATRQAMYRQNVNGTWSSWYSLTGGGSSDTSTVVTIAAANPNQLYFRNSSGSPAGLSFGTAASNGIIVQRDSNGQIVVPSPTGASHAASKNYVDQMLAWTGTANLSESTQSRGSTVVRTNRALNPRATGGTNWGNSGYGTNGAATQTFPSTAGSLVTWSTKATAGGHSTTHGLPSRTFAAGTTLTVSAEVTSDVAKQAQVRVLTASSTDGPLFQLAAGVPQRIYGTFTFGSSQTAPTFEFRLPDVTGVGTFAVDKVLIETGTDVGTYFDGNASDVATRASDVGALPTSAADAGQLHGKNSGGTEIGVTYGTAASGNAVVQRGSSGQITLPGASPSAATDAAHKSYVDAATVDLASNGRLGRAALDVSNTDLNALVSGGFYRGNRLTNAPLGATSWHFILVNPHATDQWVQQTLTEYAGEAGNALVTRRTWSRLRQSGVWKEWVLLSDNTGAVDSYARSMIYPQASVVVETIAGTQTPASSTWTRVSMNSIVSDEWGAWDSGNNWYQIPYEGTWDCTGTIRFVDSAFTGTDVAIGIGTLQGDNNTDVLWTVPGPKRASVHFNRKAYFYQGQQVRLFCYLENKSVKISTASLGLNLMQAITAPQ